ncbi:stage V sporulation protein AE [uncultured Clostridium sp.]|jgi:stage V sporulation protein AE|uniref:stage V sporulation protein AE n=1 Tax=uncultured Clostridium sp. TaxID=59620 RepID=UPI002613A298|nr:stage V sporulation protein AE [uncultured Clostridium sp.]
MWNYISAFIVGGIICVIGQIVKDMTKISPGKILVTFMLVGLVLGAFGIYQKIIEFGGAGASIPLPSFGMALANGVMKAVREEGIIGIFTGGIKGTSAGITAAIVVAYLMALIFNPKPK